VSDTDRLIALLQDRRQIGLHTHEARKLGISGNPSQRAKDAVTAGTPLRKRRENVGRRQGMRLWLEEHAPIESDRVTPNRESSDPSSSAARNGTETAGPDPAVVADRSPAPVGDTLFEVPAERPISAVTGRRAA
jgi:hypothetical protein